PHDLLTRRQQVGLDPSCRPASSIATTVCVRLCASIPRITILRYPPSRRVGTGRWAHLSGGDATLLSSHAGRSPTSEGRHKACCPRRAPMLGANPSDTDQLDTEIHGRAARALRRLGTLTLCEPSRGSSRS